MPMCVQASVCVCVCLWPASIEMDFLLSIWAEIILLFASHATRSYSSYSIIRTNIGANGQLLRNYHCIVSLPFSVQPNTYTFSRIERNFGSELRIWATTRGNRRGMLRRFGFIDNDAMPSDWCATQTTYMSTSVFVLSRTRRSAIAFVFVGRGWEQWRFRHSTSNLDKLNNFHCRPKSFHLESLLLSSVQNTLKCTDFC